MTGRVVCKLDCSKKLLLLAAGWMALAALVVVLVPVGWTQSPVGGKKLEFDVASIRHSQPGQGQQQIGPSADGYRMKNMFLEIPILTAYTPTVGGAAFYAPDQTVGFLDWVINDTYDIDAKVSEADLANWKNPALQPAMLRAMLQSMLTDRLKLVVHRSMKETAVYSLVVGKNGPKFKETNPAKPHQGFTLPGGAIISTEFHDGERIDHFYGISIPMVGGFLLGSADRPVQDKTGLAGLYDITIRSPAPVRTPQGEQPQNAAPPDPGPSVFTKAEELGLKLVPEKGQVETLVIDHIERPSEN